MGSPVVSAKRLQRGSCQHRPVATGRNILTEALKYFKRSKCSEAVVVPAQASSRREESPGRGEMGLQFLLMIWRFHVG